MSHFLDAFDENLLLHIAHLKGLDYFHYCAKLSFLYEENHICHLSYNQLGFHGTYRVEDA